jgi:hypothetical protein
LWQYRCYYQRCYMRYDCIVKYIYTLSSWCANGGSFCSQGGIDASSTYRC